MSPTPAPKNASNLYTSSGFSRVNRKIAYRLIMATDGPEKSGKTNFAMTMPDPVAIIDTDLGLEGVVDKFQADKELYAISTEVSLQELKELKPEVAAAEAQKVWSRVMKGYLGVLGTARSIVVDNATELWEILRMARFGKLDHVKPHHYAPVNAEYRDFIRLAYDQTTTSLNLIHKIKDEYANDNRTGNKIRAGFSDTGFLVQVNCSCWRAISPKGQPAIPFPDFFHMTVNDCRQNMEIAGMDLSGSDVNFPTLAVQVFPDTKERDWT
jgi:hypothetical protein